MYIHTFLAFGEISETFSMHRAQKFTSIQDMSRDGSIVHQLVVEPSSQGELQSTSVSTHPFLGVFLRQNHGRKKPTAEHGSGKGEISMTARNHTCACGLSSSAQSDHLCHALVPCSRNGAA